MKTAILLFCFLFINLVSFGQGAYDSLVGKAASLYKSKDYKGAAKMYDMAFKSLGNRGYENDRYNAACCWALAGISDSAFAQLQKIVIKTFFKDYDHIIADVDLVALHKDSRWLPLLDLIRKNKAKAEENLNIALGSELDSVFTNDQKYRLLINDTAKEYGGSSDGLKKLWETIRVNDSVNQIKVTAILDKYGWLGADIIGGHGNEALFLVIQHADIKTQEKYLPMMREAVKKGNARASSLGLLEDRVALREGRKQIYGSQISCSNGVCQIDPIEDEINVNNRRASIGLEPLEMYVKHWGIVYKLPEK